MGQGLLAGITSSNAEGAKLRAPTSRPGEVMDERQQNVPRVLVIF